MGMKKHLVMAIAAAFVAGAAWAADEVKWGEPVNGLRLGVESLPGTITSDIGPAFTVQVQNVSDHAITIPTADTFLAKKNAALKADHQTFLAPVVKWTNSQTGYPEKWPHHSWVMTGREEGKALADCPAQVVTLAAGETAVWPVAGLREKYYVGETPEPDGVTQVQRSYLSPGEEYDVSFALANEQVEVAGAKVWTGTAASGTVHLLVKLPPQTEAQLFPTPPPSAKALQLTGMFTLPKEQYFMGEPIEATFTVTNGGMETVQFEGGGCAASGRNEDYKITAVDEAGKPVIDPSPFYGVDMSFKPGVVPPGKSYTDKMLANRWCVFPGPGKYVITFRRTLKVAATTAPPEKFYLLRKELLQQTIETKLPVTLVDDSAAFKEHLAAMAPDWKQDPKAPMPPAAVYAELGALAAAQNEAAFPVMVKFLDGPLRSPAIAVTWLRHYPAERVAPLLLERFSTLPPEAKANAMAVLAKSDLPEAEQQIAAGLQDRDTFLRTCAVSACTQKHFESCGPILLTMGDDPYPLVQVSLPQALAKNGDVQAMPVLMKIMRQAPNFESKLRAVNAMCSLQPSAGIGMLVDLLRDPNLSAGYVAQVEAALRGLSGREIKGRGAWLDWWEQIGKSKYIK